MEIVVQLVRMPDCGSGDHGFESRLSPKMLRWLSWTELLATNEEVAGSNPPPATDVRMPEWSKGVVCKTITHRFESDSLLYAERGSTEVIMAGRTSFLYHSQEIVEFVFHSAQHFI